MRPENSSRSPIVEKAHFSIYKLSGWEIDFSKTEHDIDFYYEENLGHIIDVGREIELAIFRSTLNENSEA